MVNVCSFHNHQHGLEAYELRREIRRTIDFANSEVTEYKRPAREVLKFTLSGLEDDLKRIGTIDSSLYLEREDEKKCIVSDSYLHCGPGEITIGGRAFPACANDGRRYLYTVYQRPESDYEIEHGLLLDDKEHLHPQAMWHELEFQLGQEGARKELAKRLREAADVVEAGYPMVYMAVLPPVGGKLVPKTVQEISVTFSYPWGG